MLDLHLPHCLSGFLLLDKELYENITTTYIIHFFILFTIMVASAIADTVLVFELIEDNNRFKEILDILNQSKIIKPIDASLTCNESIDYDTFNQIYISYSHFIIIYLILFTLGLVVTFVITCNAILWTVLKYRKQTPLVFRYINSLTSFVFGFHQNIPQIIIIFAIIGLRHNPQGLYCASCFLTRHCIQSDTSIIARSYGATAKVILVIIYSIYYGSTELRNHVGLGQKEEDLDKAYFKTEALRKWWRSVPKKFHTLPLAILYTIAYGLQKLLSFPIKDHSSMDHCPKGFEFLRSMFWGGFKSGSDITLAIGSNLKALQGSLFPDIDLAKVQSITTIFTVIIVYSIALAIISCITEIKSQMKSGQSYVTAALILLLFIIAAPFLLFFTIFRQLQELFGRY